MQKKEKKTRKVATNEITENIKNRWKLNCLRSW